MSRISRSTKTRIEILDAAWDLISRHGADISMSQIAKAAGISRQAVYLHFGTRGGLLMALVKRADERFEIKEDFFEAMQIEMPEDRLDTCLQVWFTFVEKILPVAKDLIRLRATDTDAAAAWDDRMSDLQAWLRQLVASLEADKALAKQWTISDATDYLWVSSSVHVWDLFVIERGWTRDRTADVLRQTISTALLQPPAK